MQTDVQWFVSALKDNQLISPAEAAALDRELGGDAELGTFAQTFVERKAAGLDPSVTTITSEGPAGMSIATVPAESSCLAVVTYWLPGPKILSTFGTVCVP